MFFLNYFKFFNKVLLKHLNALYTKFYFDIILQNPIFMQNVM